MGKTSKETKKMKEECAFAPHYGQESPHPCKGNLSLHHVVYKREGGKNGQTIPLCKAHHDRIHNNEVEWIKREGRETDVLPTT